MKTPTPRRHNGFTLIELLVVISIIALLIGILLPALGAARSSAISIQSKSQLRQFGIAFLTYAADSKDHLPYNWVPNTPPGEKFRQPTWVTLGSNSFQWLNSGPQEGTIYDYVGQADELYRSPALETGEVNSGVGSNGKYDYSTIAAFNATAVGDIVNQSEVHIAGDDPEDSIDVPTPLLMEEDPEFAMNNGWPDSAHTFNDRLGSWHNSNTGNYTAVDGSTHTFEPGVFAEHGRQVEAREWFSRAPSGNLVSLGDARQMWEDSGTTANPADRKYGNMPEFGPGEWGSF